MRFLALDNAPYDVTLDPETHHAYQQTYFHALGKDGIADLVTGYYWPFVDSLSDATDVEYSTVTYTDQRGGPAFHAEFLRTLEVLDDLKWWLNPSTGVVHTRLPRPGDAVPQRHQRTLLRPRPRHPARDAQRRRLGVWLPACGRGACSFTCRDEATLTRVTRVARYSSFEEMFDHENADAINPTASRAEQLRAIRDIFPPEKESLGVLAIAIEKV